MLRAYSARHGAYIYGPVCVTEAERGQGLVTALFAMLQRQLIGREGITFIQHDNTISLLAHAKMAIREVAVFTPSDVKFVDVSDVG